MNLTLPEVRNPFTKGKLVKADCPIQEYLNSKGGQNGEPVVLSRGDLCEIHLNAARWHGGFRRPDDRTPSKEFGSLFDCLLTQPHRLNEYYRKAPDTYETKKGETKDWTWRSSTCREWRDEVEAGGQLVYCDDDLKEVRQAVAALLAHPKHGAQVKRLMETATPQVFCMAEYHDEETGIVVCVRVLTDWVSSLEDPEFGKCLFDVKTAKSAHPRPWRKAVFENDYHVQGALGLDVYSAATGEDRCDFRHLIVENVHPWYSCKRFLTAEYLTIARLKVVEALKTYCRGVKTGEWPGYALTGMVLDDGFEACEPEAYMIT